MKRTDTWIVVGILLSGAIALFAKSAGAAPFQITLQPGQVYRFTWGYSKTLSAADQGALQLALAGSGASSIVVNPTEVSYNMAAAAPATMAPGQSSTVGGVVLKLVSVVQP